MSGHKRYYTVGEVAEFLELSVDHVEVVIRQSGLFTASRTGLKYFYQHADLLAIRRFLAQQQSESMVDQDLMQLDSSTSGDFDGMENDPFGLLHLSTIDQGVGASQEPDFVDVLGMIADDSAHQIQADPAYLIVQEAGEISSHGSFGGQGSEVEHKDHIEAYVQDASDEVLALPSKWSGAQSEPVVSQSNTGEQGFARAIHEIREQTRLHQQEHQASRQKERETIRQEIVAIAALLRN